MPTNEQRRATAKRKLERQLERRAAQGPQAPHLHDRRIRRGRDRRGRRRGGHRRRHQQRLRQPDRSAATTTPTSAVPATPAGARRSCPPSPRPPTWAATASTRASPEQASKPVKPPRTGKVPTEPAQVSASMATNQGNIGLQLDNAKSPCTVNSFASLAQQGYFNDTPCHRLTTRDGAVGAAVRRPDRPGHRRAGLPVRQRVPDRPVPARRPQAEQPVIYPRGTLAMANAGPGTNGSQFFLVYKDSQLPPNYTVFGTIDADRPGHAGQDRCGRHRRRRPGRQAEDRRQGQVDPAGLTP